MHKLIRSKDIHLLDGIDGRCSCSDAQNNHCNWRTHGGAETRWVTSSAHCACVTAPQCRSTGSCWTLAGIRFHFQTSILSLGAWMGPTAFSQFLQVPRTQWHANYLRQVHFMLRTKESVSISLGFVETTNTISSWFLSHLLVGRLTIPWILYRCPCCQSSILLSSSHSSQPITSSYVSELFLEVD